MSNLDDGHDCSYAYANAPSPVSWNPAFRKDHESPMKSTFDHAQLEKKIDSDLEVQQQDVQEAWAAIGDGPVDAITDPDETAARMDTLPEATLQELECPPRQSSTDEANTWTDEAPASQTYDFQGKSTKLDEAVLENASSPLLTPDSPFLAEATALTDKSGGGEWAPGAKQVVLQQEDDFLPDFEAQSEKWDAMTSHLPLLTDRAETAQTVEPVTEGTIVEVANQVVAHEADAEWGTQDNGDFDFETIAEPEPEPEPEPVLKDSADFDFESIAEPLIQEDAPTAGDISVAGTSMLIQANGEKPPEEDISAMWAATLDDDELLTEEAAEAFAFDVEDGDDFLAEIGADAAQEHTRTISEKYTPATVQQPAAAATPSNAYPPQNPQLADLSTRQKAQPGASGGPTTSPYQSPYTQQQPQRPKLPTSAQSFVDKSKGGYHSPYDLPEDLSVKKRRSVLHHGSASPLVPQQMQPPPPRLRSMQSTPALPLSRPQPPRASSSSNYTPPTSSHGLQGLNGPSVPPQAAIASQANPPRPSSTGFFEDLPVSQKPVRHATPAGRYTPNIGPGPVPTPPPQALPVQLGSLHASPPPLRTLSAQYASAQAHQQGPPLVPQLQAPARMMPYAEEQHVSGQVGVADPPVSSRYSPGGPSGPAVGGVQSHSPLPPPPPPVSSRYSPAPGSKPQVAAAQPSYNSGPPPLVGRSNSLPYAPRTSSPLAHHSVQSTPRHTPATSIAYSERGDPTSYSESPPGRSSLDRHTTSQPALGTVAENEPYGAPSDVNALQQSSLTPSNRLNTPPPTKIVPSSAVISPRKRSNYAPTGYQPTAPTGDSVFNPPHRSQTSSPGASLKNPRLAMSDFDRPSSAQGPAPNAEMGAGVPSMASMQQRPNSQEMNLVQPQDERAQDPLQRWKGAPIFRWGIGNSVVTSFPKHVPRYIAGQMGPVMQPTQLEIRTRNMSEVSPPSETLLKFPGPLRKGKKKEILAWLKATTEAREAEHQRLSMHGELTSAAHQRSEEKLLLWKIMAILVENDGALDGTPVINDAVRKIISPATPGTELTADAFGITQSTPIRSQPEAFDPAGVNVLRNHLYGGQREQAVWYAVDQRLWAHALLIAQTIDNKDIWKQVVQEFVRKEVRNLGDNTEALAALYQIFAGNHEESIDELVSVSARAGFQMVSTAGNGNSQKDALAGLNRWRETVLLVLNNRSPGDANALVSLGKLLAGYGRTEAAHICFIFARGSRMGQPPAMASLFGGIDDPNSSFSLVGSSTATQGSDFGQDLDSILLSEVYEFTLTLGSGAVPSIPHLQAFKLYHAEVLAESGRRTEAQQYCDTIATAITSKSHRSPYHNQQLMQWVDKLTQRLAQAPADSSSSWKPSMDKVSTSLWGKFNTFIAGTEDSDAISSGSGAAPASDGQFARISGETPPLSRAVSTGDMYGAYQPTGAIQPPPAAETSRYAPGSNAYAPRSSSDQQRPRYDPQAQSAYQPRASTESTRSAYEPRSSMDGMSSSPQRASVFNTYAPGSAQAAPLQQAPFFAPPDSNLRTPMSSYSPNAYQPNAPESSVHGIPYESTPPSDSYKPQSNGYQPSPSFPTSEETSANSYEPPSTSYEPPTYQPYMPDEQPWDADGPDSPVDEKKPKKKMFGDDDDDDEILRRAAALKDSKPGSKSKSDADRATDEAFRKAAEADAAKSGSDLNGGAEKKRWFGSWFKGKDSDAQQSGPIKAKLGEENSFVYDENLKKWVNKKGGAAAVTPTAATPPPPKVSGPPSRPSSAFGVSSAQPANGTIGPPQPGVMLPPIGTPMAVGSTLPGSSGGVVASGDLGTTPPMSRSSSGMIPPAAAASRPASSMSNASDADDIMGSLAPRARGKKAPRKGRYVDVMANQK
ncbi:hypothetical protein E2P81_ATG07185 [Venturia nashicola]|uniref:Protein transport protein sec16 n=1 Tax=Venturia nashicola TaxID=86259 RepID=A0A4Z1PEM3_9PEZI|nr:hypothetical protein E6O75_ATG07348 [Venturia nashicola]TLD31695.1 hypothetical protein E2P81_ATG07185 [Venturia nashicola]